jgi:site-specific recombinase XerD
VMQRLGAIADIPQELRHPHALRHTCARELLRTGATIADVQRLLGHASIKTTSIYLTSDEQRQEDAVVRRERGRLTLDEDLDG